jgi:hypothetical protein
MIFSPFRGFVRPRRMWALRYFTSKTARRQATDHGAGGFA